ncbi:hypothetical protein L596_024202 [Steinernema carpocapsae]|uniref:Uncharacterized protein n=1 Tax=Steinernema carpocapsae TaxID=34508 RepID=A0A4U5MG18_STECR|nr:hypothetical protein L596_024202 [Steinernema carpocapsae]
MLVLPCARKSVPLCEDSALIPMRNSAKVHHVSSQINPKERRRSLPNPRNQNQKEVQTDGKKVGDPEERKNKVWLSISCSRF